MKRYHQLAIGALLLGAILIISCKKDSATSGSSGTTSGTVPDVFKKFNSTVTISSDGSTITLKSDGIPDHKSCYFAGSDSRYQAYNGTNTAFSKNPNSIGTKSYTFKIPAAP